MVKNKFVEMYIQRMNAEPCVGVEIEMPIINHNYPYQIDKMVINGLFTTLFNYSFMPISFDNGNDCIAARHQSEGDVISLEYSLNTLEFSLSKEDSIFGLEEKFDRYYSICSVFLMQYQYSLEGNGINPNYHQINMKCLDQNRYLTIERLLTNGKNGLEGNFCAYCCSVQTHVNISRKQLIDVLNMFTRIEKIKSNFFANSYMVETKLKDSRNFLWNKSNFGPNNSGSNPIFHSVDELVDDYLGRNLFFVERGDDFLIFKEKQKIRDYFSKTSVEATNQYGESVLVMPEEDDFMNFRSYRSVELTKYGTIEIRTDCTQSVSRIFPMVAFNVGVVNKASEINEYIKEKGTIDFEQLLNFAKAGLKERNKREERYWYSNEKNWNLDV